MALLGDQAAVGVRRTLLRSGAFASVDAFPQKDDRNRRVFREAKLSTVVFTAVRGSGREVAQTPFTSRVHPANTVEAPSPRLELCASDVPLYDPENLTIVSCSQEDWDLAARILRTGRMRRLGEFVEFFQGEVNETNERKKGTIVPAGNGAELVTRGACLCLYVPRDASQGDDLFLDVEGFLRDKELGTKAFHHRHAHMCTGEFPPEQLPAYYCSVRTCRTLLQS